MIWRRLHHPMIKEGYLISETGMIKCETSPDDEYSVASYHSTNGYDYAMFIVNDEYRMSNALFMLFPIDEIVALTFIPVPDDLTKKRITVKHIDGDTHNIELSNLQWVEDVEEWRDIDDPDISPNRYQISSWGRVRDINTNKIHNGFIVKKYMSTNLRCIDERHTCSRHINRLVATAFVGGSSQSRCIVNHINGNSLCDLPKNLEWVTYSENTRHSYLCGLSIPRRGEKSHSSKISNDIARHIWLLLIDDPETLNGRPPTGGSPAQVKKYADIDLCTEVSLATISNIKRDKGWGDVIFDNSFEFKQTSISPEMAKHIWLLLIDDPETLNGRPPTGGCCRTVHDYVNDSCVSLQNIYSIKFKHSWKSVTDKLPQGNLKDGRRKIDAEMAKHIWLLLIDDPETLNGRPPTGGSPLLVQHIIEDEGKDINLNAISSIKRKDAWCEVTDNLPQIEFKPLHPKYNTPEMAKHIWLLLIDDPETLNGRPPTGGSPALTLKYAKEDGLVVSMSTVKSIKYRTSWKEISYERTW